MSVSDHKREQERVHLHWCKSITAAKKAALNWVSFWWLNKNHLQTLTKDILASKFSVTWWATLIWNFILVIPKLYAVITSTFSQHADRCATKYLPFRVTVQVCLHKIFRESTVWQNIWCQLKEEYQAFNSTSIFEPQPFCILMTYPCSAE